MLFAAYFIEVGLVLVIVPWSSYWERNFFVGLLPSLGLLADSYYFRGAVSGVGLINVVAGLAELLGLTTTQRRHADLPGGVPVEEVVDRS